MALLGRKGFDNNMLIDLVRDRHFCRLLRTMYYWVRATHPPLLGWLALIIHPVVSTTQQVDTHETQLVGKKAQGNSRLPMGCANSNGAVNGGRDACPAPM